MKCNIVIFPLPETASRWLQEEPPEDIFIAVSYSHLVKRVVFLVTFLISSNDLKIFFWLSSTKEEFGKQ